MFESAAPLRAEFGELEAALADPAVHADLARARKVGRRYAEADADREGARRVRPNK
jgi:peptide chain release factor 1